MTQGGHVSPPPKSRSGATRAATRGPQGRRESEERYQRGGRRTTGEPLAAAWQPDAEPSDESSPRLPPVRRRRGILAVYGWRLYAIPVLLVITALVVWDTSQNKPVQAQSADSARNAAVSNSGDAPVDPGGPGANEQPASPIDVKIPTADLPPGANFTLAGTGGFRVIPGNGSKVGQGTVRTYTYTVEIEDGINPAEFGGGDDAFAGLVDATLADQRGWTSDPKIAVQRVAANPVMRVTLATPETTHKLCGFNIPYESSCRLVKDGRVVINLARWVRGAMVFNGDIGLYRQYAINHEVGHAFGNSHLACGANGELAPVMMQQTFGVANDFVAKLNEGVRGNKDPVKADGKVCKPNAWSNPQGKPGA